ncbi:MAG TPA: glycosyltransferase family 2 protein [Bacteroidota bacterium]|nr:glycosyltransferase family 2 protein [Bacteroidota bacterium]
MPARPQVSVIIVSYNRLGVLRDSLRSMIQNLGGTSYEIILLDNASSEPVVKTIKKEFPSVRMVENPQNYGFGKANNIGAQHASREFLLFVNSDILLKANPVPEMVNYLKEHNDVGIVGCSLRNADGSLQPSFFRFPSLWLRFVQLTGLKAMMLALFPRLRFKSPSDTRSGFVSGAFLMIRADLFSSLGGFDERYFMYLEDADLGYQVKKRGLRSSLMETDSVVHLGRHYEESDNPFVMYNMNKGLLLFYEKHFAKWRLYCLAFLGYVGYSARLLLARNDKHYRDEIRAVMNLYARMLFGNPNVDKAFAGNK